MWEIVRPITFTCIEKSRLYLARITGTSVRSRSQLGVIDHVRSCHIPNFDMHLTFLFIFDKNINLVRWSVARKLHFPISNIKITGRGKGHVRDCPASVFDMHCAVFFIALMFIFGLNCHHSETKRRSQTPCSFLKLQGHSCRSNVM